MLQQRLLRSFLAASKQTPALPTSRISPSASQPKVAFVASQQLASRRWYSAETEAKKEEVLKEQAEAQGAQETPKKDAAKEDPVQKELEAKKQENVDLTDRLKRQIAEYRNLQEQTKREVQAARDFSLQRFAKDLLESIDNLDRALEAVPKEKLTSENQDLVNLHSGLKMTERILMGTLKKHGMEKFDPSVEGDKFDPNKHEATFMTPQPDKPDNTVFHCQSKGFLYNGRVLRAAKVGVVKNS
ncbi:unnamed protein product [Zymoseptoria tritici ST99CH_1A5]|uniref:GrpE protein homolog n=4 Tax=Zymoseptoria tritici TaxID=1047171 RepID=F9WY66_ZYMTI|nr:uncharacterized protein MYCGRDRAFT_102569 [Zymoseptoria tritici IPO323]SMQ46115.1 unnamed protein product [Zymoseptoria tritici ST99CH_3D7]SMR42460.1 unnamed protein product [Zymoseptoria tritici ST99CH_1E4]SMR44638.1 unnamed protein product [Zymoseptoria tritici ST99CH_3D1]SMY19801.1 unnamed protein product [Zymoseptoria tritici ST99CH_1A5]EGP91375.1 hypothetical protein MYCGRDRAFT_102569 [Zymoseptoria tritici IPO323]